MKQGLLKVFALLVFILFFLREISAQNCIPTNINGATINLACNQICQDLTFQIPHINSTSDYVLTNIQYNPYLYVTPTGNQDLALYEDDTYSFSIPLPFQFCFYGMNFGNIVVESNGLITFDQANASGFNTWNITQTIPFAGGTICSASGTYYPRAAIMAASSDIDPRPEAIGPPSANSSPADRKIEWRVEGVAPCRKYIVSFYHIGVFVNNPCSQTTPNTFQIILHESTGIVDIFIEQKACFASTAGGRAILEIQNWNRDQSIAAPGKNNTQCS